MANDRRIMELIATFRDKASKGVKGLSDRADNLKKNYFNISMFVKDTINAVKQLNQVAREGAQVEQIGEQYEMMAKRANVSSNRLLSDLRKMSVNTVSDTDLMKTAVRALTFEFDPDKLPKLMEIARQRGKQFGLDTTAAFQDLVSGISRNSPLILDNIGFITKGMKKGSTTADLMNVILKQGTEELVKLGKQGLSSAEKLAKFEASISNASDAIKQELSLSIVGLIQKIPFVERFVELWQDQKARAPVELLTNKVRDLTRSLDALKAAQHKMAQGQSLSISETIKATKAVEEHSGKNLMLTLSLDNVNAAMTALATKRKEQILLQKKAAASQDIADKKMKAERDRIKALDAADARRKEALNLLPDLKKLNASLEIQAETDRIAQIGLMRDQELVNLEEKYGALLGRTEEYQQAKSLIILNSELEIAKETANIDKKALNAQIASQKAAMATRTAAMGAAFEIANAFIKDAKLRAVVKVLEEVALAFSDQAMAATMAANPATAALAPGYQLSAKMHFIAAAKHGIIGGIQAAVGGGRGGGGGGGGAGASPSFNDGGGGGGGAGGGTSITVHIDALDAASFAKSGDRIASGLAPALGRVIESAGGTIGNIEIEYK